MPLDPHVRRFLDMMALGRPAEPGVDTRREGQRILAQLAGPDPLPVTTADFQISLPSGLCTVRMAAPVSVGKPGPGLIFFHGGGLVAGNLETHDAICRRLADAAQCRVLAVDYRLAPEHPFPAALDDACAAIRVIAGDCARFGIDPARLAVGGESAGAGLAARACQELRRGGPPIARQLLLCPVLDLRGTSPSQLEFAQGYLLDAATIRHDVVANGVTDRVADPRVSPLLEPDLFGLPAAHIHTAACDMFRDDGAAYADRLTSTGVTVHHHCHDGMIHFFYGLGRLVPKARPALSAIGRSFGAALHGRSLAPDQTSHEFQERRAS